MPDEIPTDEELDGIEKQDEFNPIDEDWDEVADTDHILMPGKDDGWEDNDA